MQSQYQKKYITDDDGNIVCCKNCGAPVYYDEDEERFIFTCPCGEVDVERLPEWAL